MTQLMEKVERLWAIPIFFTKGENCVPKGFGAFLEEESPFICAPSLVGLLVEKCRSQELPVVYQDENHVIFACIRVRDGYYLTGPVCTEELGYTGLHRFYEYYGLPGKERKHPARTSLSRILTFTAVLNEMENKIPLEAEDILKANALAETSEKEVEKEDIMLEMRKLDEDLYHHTYQEERYVMEAVAQGRPAEARRRADALLGSAGILSGKKKNHYRNLAMTAVTIATREVIQSGVSPAKAYRLSDIFINRIDQCTKTEELEEYYRRALYEFAKLAADTKEEKTASSYTEQCKDYIYKNYNRKIYLEDIAKAIGISPGHLSRVFHKDMDISIQEYIRKFRVERAANLLKYSEASLAEISDYVCFHSQSHFGSAFRQYMKMTPRQYRDRYKEKEFRSQSIPPYPQAR